ncbi:MAG: hypothetical protein PHS93_09645 [Candidatus Omnitrophica bacterium]|nr:hypothetical protein [Candidatus Omnitrophota bacterium]
MDKIEELLNKSMALSQDMAKILTQQHYDVLKRLVLLEQDIENYQKERPKSEEIDLHKKSQSDDKTATTQPEFPEPELHEIEKTTDEAMADYNKTHDVKKPIDPEFDDLPF